MRGLAHASTAPTFEADVQALRVQSGAAASCSSGAPLCGAEGSGGGGAELLCDYEHERGRTVAENQEYLRSLGHEDDRPHPAAKRFEAPYRHVNGRVAAVQQLCEADALVMGAAARVLKEVLPVAYDAMWAPVRAASVSALTCVYPTPAQQQGRGSREWDVRDALPAEAGGGGAAADQAAAARRAAGRGAGRAAAAAAATAAAEAEAEAAAADTADTADETDEAADTADEADEAADTAAANQAANQAIAPLASSAAASRGSAFFDAADDAALPTGHLASRVSGAPDGADEALRMLVACGVSNMHVDRADAPRACGVPIVYVPQVSDAALGHPKYRASRPLPSSDLVLAENGCEPGDGGGRFVRVVTCVAGWACIVLAHYECQLHGGVYPTGTNGKLVCEAGRPHLVPLLVPGVELLRCVCYQMARVGGYPYP